MTQPKEPLRKGCQDEVIQVYEAHDRAIHSHRDADVNQRAIATASQVEILAKLYLEGDPAEISDATLIELCDWLWSEFQSTPLNLQFSWYRRYNSAAQMFADIQQGHLWVSFLKL